MIRNQHSIQQIDTLSPVEVLAMLKKNGFFDNQKNPIGKGIKHDYEVFEFNFDRFVVDHTTGLSWQQSGQEREMEHKEANDYIHSLNSTNYGGSNDWRLPTLEEAMYLMERELNDDGLFIDSAFDSKQKHIWTADIEDATFAWFVDFSLGYCASTFVDNFRFVRAVTSL
jgi:hypothetical protein